MQIYKITNLLNGKIYIGKDTTNDNNYFGSGLLIKRSIDKFGIENFKKEIIEECETNEILCEREKFWIKHFNSTNLDIGYNISFGGDGGDIISNHPNRIEILNKISQSMKKRTFTDAHRENLSKNHYSSKYRLGKNYNEMYGDERAKQYIDKLKSARKKYNNQKDRLGEKYDNYILQLKHRFLGENNPMKKNKYYWYYNPETGEQTRISENGIVPNGYIKGRKKI